MTLPELSPEQFQPPSPLTRVEDYSDGVRFFRRTGSRATTVVLCHGLGIAMWVFWQFWIAAVRPLRMADVGFFALVLGGISLLVCGLLINLLQREEITLTKRGLTYSRGIRPNRSRLIPLSELVSVGHHTRQDEARTTKTVRLRTLSKPIDFAAGVSGRERDWLLLLFREWFAHFGIPQQAARDRVLVPFPIERADPDLTRHTLLPASEPRPQPSESHYRLQVEHEGCLRLSVPIVTPRDWMIGMVISTGLLLVWGVSFVPNWFPLGNGGRDWRAFDVLAALFGFFLGVVWIGCVIYPGYRNRYFFEADGVTHRRSLFGLAHEVQVPFSISPILELRPTGRTTGGSSTATDSGEGWELHFVTSEEQTLRAVPGLTYGEGTWLGQCLLAAFPSWSERADQLRGRR